MVNAICKQCNQSAEAEKFIFSPDFDMMVCPNCLKSRGNENLQNKTSEPQKPAGWDIEDEYLEKAWKNKEKSKVEVERIDEFRVKYPCPECNYSFIYDKISKKPARCPFCSADIQQF